MAPTPMIAIFNCTRPRRARNARASDGSILRQAAPDANGPARPSCRWGTRGITSYRIALNLRVAPNLRVALRLDVLTRVASASGGYSCGQRKGSVSHIVDCVVAYAEPHAEAPKGSYCLNQRETDHERAYHFLCWIGYS